jgi:hydroxymethylglutaryl-CoA reductase
MNGSPVLDKLVNDAVKHIKFEKRLKASKSAEDKLKSVEDLAMLAKATADALKVRI